MPNLLLMVPCEVVVIAENGLPTLVNILSEFTMGGLPEIVPQQAAIPYRWFIFSEWQLAPEDLHNNWEQRVRLTNVAGVNTGLDHIAEMIPDPNKPLHRMIATLNFFPILPQGNYALEISIRRSGQPNWEVRQLYPLSVKR